jgi:hypothetical protein
MSLSRMNVVMRDVLSFQFISLCLSKIPSVPLRYTTTKTAKSLD